MNAYYFNQSHSNQLQLELKPFALLVYFRTPEDENHEIFQYIGHVFDGIPTCLKITMNHQFLIFLISC